jgi:AraC-like DNA-binding protein
VTVANNAAVPRALPIRLPPLPGEPLDSWVAAYAARLQTPISDLAAGLGPGSRFWRQPTADIALGNGVDEVAGLATAAGLTSMQVKHMWWPLARYCDQVNARFPAGWLKWMARPMRWSRFCPACLAATNGRWQATWRLPWQLACPTHAVLLCATCPRCDGRQRQRALLQEIETAQTLTCDIPRPDATGRGDHRCGTDLREASEPGAPSRLLELQEHLAPLVDPSTTAPAMAALIDHLADTLTVARQRDLTPGAVLGSAMGNTAALAAALDRAQRAVTGVDPHALLELVLADVHQRPRPLPRLWRTASTTLASKVITSRDSHLRPFDRIRWRSTTTGARPTIGGDDSRHHNVPTALWADWVVRLQPPDNTPVLFSQVAAAALLLPGATRPLAAILANFTPDGGLSASTSTVLQNLAATEHGPTIFRALTQLSDGLLAYGSPIDYQRRRRLSATATLIDPASWDRISAQAGINTGGQRKLRWARLWIWETITGGALGHAPRDLRPIKPEELNSYHRFPIAMTPLVAELLDAHARHLLDAVGCHDEPTTWSPPAEWVDITALPGRDPAGINPEHVGALLRQRLAPSDVAQRLGVSLDHVRLLIRRHPPHLRLRSTGRQPARRNPFPAQLTRERLQELVVDERRTLRSIRTEAHVSEHALRSALQRDGIPIPPPGRASRVKIDEGWLRAQYLDRHRTLPDIAAELGMSPSNLARTAQRHRLPIRPRGGASHAASLSAPDGWPPPLASAILGRDGRQRVERFQVYARARSLHEGATRLSTTTSVLVTQLALLERACEGTLIQRSTSQHDAQQLTPLGDKLLEQANRHLGPIPDAPPPVPELLSPAPRASSKPQTSLAPTPTPQPSLRGLEAACQDPPPRPRQPPLATSADSPRTAVHETSPRVGGLVESLGIRQET